MSRMKCRSCSTMTSVQCALIGASRVAGHPPLLRAHAAGRLVEQQQLGPERQRHGDLEPLLLAVAELAGEVVGAVDQAEALEQRRDLAVEGAARRRQQQARQALARLDGQQDVVVDRELGQDGGDLEFQAQAQAGALVGRRARDVVAVEHDGAAVGEVGAGDRLQQRALARAVGPDQPVERAGLHVDIDALQRPQGAERLG